MSDKSRGEQQDPLSDEIRAVKEALAVVRTEKEVMHHPIQRGQCEDFIRRTNPRFLVYLDMNEEALESHLERLERDRQAQERGEW